ncbi:MBG domain-containing protein, partial [Mucilaginibacter sp. OK283]|uniref:MBG domain-containing protein n=1 Tax=Mucilaginibacter sp. OK283 TaxID=1881049 RepID=UPI0008D77017
MIKNLTTKTLLIILLLSAINALAMPVSILPLVKNANKGEYKNITNSHLASLNHTLPSLPDLVIIAGSQTVSPASVLAGGNVKLTCSESNIGTAAAKANTVVLYLSKTNKLNIDSATCVGTIAFGALNVNSSISVSSTLQIPNTTPGGNYFLFYWADGNNAVAESNETNNQASVPLTVIPGQATVNAITLQNLKIIPGEIRVGNKVTISGTLNTNVPYNNNMRQLDVYLSSDQNLTTVATDGDFYLGQMSVWPYIGDKQKLDFSAQLPNSIGTYAKDGTVWYVVITGVGEWPPLFIPVKINNAAPVLTVVPLCFGLSSRMQLNWPAVKDAVSYDILKNNAYIATISSGTTYTDTAVIAGKTYLYEIKANGGAGFSGTAIRSAVASNNCTVPLPKKPVVTLTTNCSYFDRNNPRSYINITFPVENNSTVYNYYVNNKEVPVNSVFDQPTRTFFYQSSSDLKVTIVVRAINSAGYIDSNPVTIKSSSCKLAPPPGPIKLTATTACNGIKPQVTLNWPDVANNNGYELQKSGQRGIIYVAAPPYIDTNVTDTTSYSYSLITRNPFGIAQSDTVKIRTAFCKAGILPYPIKLLFQNECIVGKPKISIFTQTYSDTYTASYDIYRQGILVKHNSPGFLIDTAVVAGTTYSYYIVAKNSAGTVTSDTVYVTANDCSPGTPVITSVNPLVAYYGDNIIIKGTHLFYDVAPTVTFGGVSATPNLFGSTPTLLAVKIGSGASGNVTVTTAQGTASFPGFKYFTGAKPQISVVRGCNHQKSQAELKWDTVNGATSFDILRDSVLIATVNTPAYIDTTVADEKNYTYTVKIKTATDTITSAASTLATHGCNISVINLTATCGDSSMLKTQVRIDVKSNNGQIIGFYRNNLLIANNYEYDFNSKTAYNVDYDVKPDSSYTYYVVTKNFYGILIASYPETITVGSCGINAPLITKISPYYIARGDTVTLTGKNFTGTTGVSFGGFNVRYFKVVSPTIITAVVDTAATAGTARVTTSFGAVNDKNYQFGLPQTLVMAHTATAVYGAELRTYGFAGTNSGLHISYSSSNSSVLDLKTGMGILRTGTTVITATQPGNSIYFPASPVTQVLTVIPAPLTITADDQTRPYNTANPPLTVSYTGFAPGESQKTALNTAPIVTTSATSSSPPGKYPITVSGATADNYVMTYVAGTLTITPPLPPPPPVITGFSPQIAVAGDKVTITGSGFTAATSVTFGGVPATAVTYVSPTSVIATVGQGISGDITLTTTDGTATFAGFVYGTNIDFNLVLTASCVNEISQVKLNWNYSGDAVSYDILRDSTVVATINPGAITSYIDNTVIGGKTYAYQVRTHTVAGTRTSQVQSIAAVYCAKPSIAYISPQYITAGDTVTITGSGFAGITSVTFGGVTARSFTVVSPTTIIAIVDSAPANGSVVVSTAFSSGTTSYQVPLVQTITMPSVALNVYGAQPFSPATSSSGLPVTYSSSSPIVVVENGKLSIKGAGKTTITASQPGNGTYKAANTVTQTLTISPALLTIRANNQTRTYKAANTPLTASYSGFVYADDTLALDKTPVLSTTATATSLPGKYPIVASGAVTANYTVTYVAGTLTITPPPAPVITSFTPQNAIAG